MKTAGHQIRVLTHPHLFEHILIKICGECCRPWSKVEKTRDQETRLAGVDTSFSLQRLPDIQDPEAPFRPLALPIKEGRDHYLIFSIRH